MSFGIRHLHGFNKQIFGVDEQVQGRGQTYLKRVGQKVMWEKQRTSTLLSPPQSEEAEFYPLCQLRPRPGMPPIPLRLGPLPPML